MEHLVFSSDGVLRAKLNEKKPALPLLFLKNKANVSELRFMSYWLNKKVIFEEGLTIGSFLSNIEPFKEYLSEYLGKDIASYIKESKKPISIEKRKNFDWITLFHNYTISEQNEIDKNKEQFLTNYWKIYENYSVAAFNKEENEHYCIEKYEIQKIQHIPLFLDKTTRIIINEKEIESIDSKQSLINKEAFGVIQQVIENYQINYLLSEKEHKFKDVVEGFFKDFNNDISSRENENEMLEEFIEDLNQEVVEDGLILKIHEGYLQKSISEMEEKENLWNNLVYKAVEEKNLIKIGKIKEGLIPEVKLFGTSIEENIRRIRLK